MSRRPPGYRNGQLGRLQQRHTAGTFSAIPRMASAVLASRPPLYMSMAGWTTFPLPSQVSLFYAAKRDITVYVSH